MISYNGKTDLKNKINNRIDEKVEQFIFEVADIRNSMPDF